METEWPRCTCTSVSGPLLTPAVCPWYETFEQALDNDPQFFFPSQVERLNVTALGASREREPPSFQSSPVGPPNRLDARCLLGSRSLER